MRPKITMPDAVVVSEPELRFAQSGKAVMRMRVVAKDRRKGANGWEDGDPVFLSVTAFGDVAERIVGTELTPGTTVVVLGDLEQREWEKDGVKRTDYQVVIGFDGVVAPSTRWDTWSKTGQVTRETASDPWANTPTTDEPPF